MAASYSALCASARCISRSTNEEHDEARILTSPRSSDAGGSLCEEGRQDTRQEEEQDPEEEEEDQEGALRRLFRSAGLAITVAVCAGTLLLGVSNVTKNEWHRDEEADTAYLTSAGLAYCTICVFVVAVLAPWLVLDVACPGRAAQHGSQPAKRLDEFWIGEVLEDGEATLPKAGWMLLLLGRALLNTLMIWQRFLRLPSRDPSQHMNEAVHIVAWVEFVVDVGIVGSLAFAALLLACGQEPLLWLWLGLLAGWSAASVYFVCDSTAAHFQVVFFLFVVLQCMTDSFERSHPYKVAKQLAASARYSVLNFMGLLTPYALQEKWNSWASFGVGTRCLLMAGRVLFYLPVAALALNAKIAQLGFMHEQPCTAWGLANWLNLAAFANNMAGVVDLERLVQHGVFEQLRQDERLPEVPTEVVQHAWMMSFGHALEDMYGPFRAVFLVATAQAADLAKLFTQTKEP